MKKLVVSGIAAASIAAGSLGVAALTGLNAASAQTSTTTPSAQTAPPAGQRPARQSTETPLTGDALEKVKAAVAAALPGSTVDRAETDDEGAPYEAHVTKADGTRATVKLDANFAVTSTTDDAGRGGRGGGKGCDGAAPADGTAPAAGSGQGRMRGPRGADGANGTAPTAPSAPATAPANTAQA